MPVIAVVGTQWGDEGKGKIVDRLASEASAPLVVRFNGGDNAGHTIVNDLGTFKLRLVPSGVLSREGLCLVGAGTLLNPDSFIAELDGLIQRGIDVNGVCVSGRAHVVLPHHLTLERIAERARGSAAQGSTGRGIAPAYADKAARIGVRVEDLLDSQSLRERLSEQADAHNPALVAAGESPIDPDAMLLKCRRWLERLAPIVVDDFALVRSAMASDRTIIAEGQLGALRDLDWGIYPYGTSSTTLAGGSCSGAGIPPIRISRVIGVTKAYTSAVGSGPVAAELGDSYGSRLRDVGLEYGTATGRPRRCGWFDAVATRFGAAITGADELALTKLDVLDGLDTVRIVTGYRHNSRDLDRFPSARVIADAEPIYEELTGWTTPTAGARELGDLPADALAYVNRIEVLVGVPVSLIGTGPHRQDLVRVC